MLTAPTYELGLKIIKLSVTRRKNVTLEKQNTYIAAVKAPAFFLRGRGLWACPREK